MVEGQSPIQDESSRYEYRVQIVGIVAGNAEMREMVARRAIWDLGERERERGRATGYFTDCDSPQYRRISSLSGSALTSCSASVVVRS